MGSITVSLVIIALVASSTNSEESCSNMVRYLEDEGLGPVNCKLTPDEPSAEVVLTFSSTLLEGRAPLLKTHPGYPKNANFESSTYLDVVALTNAGPSVWSFKTNDNSAPKSRYLYVNKPKSDKKFPRKGRKQDESGSNSQEFEELRNNELSTQATEMENNMENVTIRLVFSTGALSKANEYVAFSFDLSFEEINVSINDTKTPTLGYESSVIYQFKYEKKDERKRIRVHVSRPDIDMSLTNKREGCSKAQGYSEVNKLCSCSVVTIQKLGTPFDQTERGALQDSEWQTMIGRSVLDIDVGGNSKDYQNGFYIVIVKKKNDTDCKLNSLDLNLDGKFDTEESEERAARIYNETIITSNGTEQMMYRSYKIEEEFTYNIQISELDDDISIYSIIITSVYLGLILFALVLSRVFHIPVTGRVESPEDHNPFSVILKICPTPKISQWNNDHLKQSPDAPDAGKATNGEAKPSNESPLEMDEMQKKSKNDINASSPLRSSSHIHRRKISSTLKPERVKTVECFYIEMCDSSDNEEMETEKSTEDTVDGSIEEAEKGKQVDSFCGLTHDIKKALQIESTKAVRIVPRCNKRQLRHERLKQDHTLADFATNCDPKMFPKTLFMKSDMYYWIMMLAGIFYILPAIQLMMMAQTLNRQTGSEDICYYNFLCRRTSKFFTDYGHVFSNVSYIFCGLAFIALVFIRRYRRRQAMIRLYCRKKHPAKDEKQIEEIVRKKKQNYSDRNIEFLNECGIPDQYGIFFAMGLALIMEGVLSASYHICPVDESFQFDTTFMYIITVLIFLKLYQFRHPDITMNAYVIFGFIALFLVFEAIGYYSPKGVYMFLFVFTYIIAIFAVIIDMYFQKNFRLAMQEIFFSRSDSKPEATYEDYKKELKAGSTARLIFFIVMGVLNLLLAIFFLYKMSNANDSIVSNYLLVVFGINMLGYAINYAIMKCYYVLKMKNSAESITFTCWIYIALTAIFGAVGMVFFKLYQEKTTLISPSESRHLNDECTFWFFDKHDVWHFCSAFGLLFIFMTLMTLEDNNTSTPWNEIPVF